jgi:parallel beta-helix repeat protein
MGLPGQTLGVPNLPTLNTRLWTPGVTLKNNLIVTPGRTGIQIGGDPNTDFAYSQKGAGPPGFSPSSIREVALYVPFVRVINNTIYDAKNGIAATNSSSPTILNNVIAESGVALTDIIRQQGAAVLVDGSAAANGTVVGATLYQNNVFNVLGTGDSNAIILPAGAPLFVDASKRNFYPADLALSIDSSVNSVQERSALFSATSQLGMPPLPIQAPDFDILGQLRVDDPKVPTPPGLGSNVFKDRGALERADFIGPTAAMAGPVDNDAGGLDRNPQPNRLQLVNQQLTQFAIQLLDGIGVGIDNTTVNAGQLTLTRTVGGVETTLLEGVDFALAYDTNSRMVRLLPVQGIWINGIYTITLNNGADGIKDIAGNQLQPNEPPITQFVIELTDQATSGWQNPNNRHDVNGSGFVSSIDVLQIVNRLLAVGSGPLPIVATPPPFYDVNGDGNCTPGDALAVINQLLSQQPPPAAPAAAPLTSTVTTLDDDLTAEPAGEANSVAVALAMTAANDDAEAVADDESMWMPGGALDDVAADAALTSAAADGQAQSLAGAWESDEFDSVDEELDSILDDLTLDARDRVWV